MIVYNVCVLVWIMSRELQLIHLLWKWVEDGGDLEGLNFSTKFDSCGILRYSIFPVMTNVWRTSEYRSIIIVYDRFDSTQRLSLKTCSEYKQKVCLITVCVLSSVTTAHPESAAKYSKHSSVIAHNVELCIHWFI